MTNFMGPDWGVIARKNMIIFLLIILNVCFGCLKNRLSKKSEYPKNRFSPKNKTKIILK